MSKVNENTGGAPPVVRAAAAAAIAGAPAASAAAPAAAVEEAKKEAATMSMADLGAIIATAVGQALAAQAQANSEAQAAMLKQVLEAVLPKKDDEPPPEDPAERQSEMEMQLAERRFLITITKGDKYAQDPVPIGVNGILRSVKRGDFAVVSYSMLGVLKNSEETHIDPDTREPYQVTCYPYSVHAEVPKELWDQPALDVANQLIPDRVQGLHSRMH